MQPCAVCGCETFNEIDGYMFCIECCTQSQNYVAMDVEDDEHNLGGDTTKIEEEKKAKLELTTWEEYNYVLIGLINQMIQLGAKEDIKLTILQLWTQYLKMAEVAFFSKKEPELPRLSASYKNKDAMILYGKQPATNKNKKRKRKSSSSVLSAKMKRKRQKQLITTEYQTQSCYADSAVNNSSSKSSVSIPIMYTRRSRKALKKKMPKKHIKVHETSDTRPNCHKLNLSNLSFRLEVPLPRILLGLMYIALNITQDALQMGDMLRFIREGHLSLMHIEDFFPNDCLISPGLSKLMSSGIMMTNNALRGTVLQIMQFNNVETLNKPDFFQLCRRYVTELALPDTIYKYVERLIRLYPPQMKKTDSILKVGPNYEGRAMAYIIFIIKLIFGLNGTTEELLSDSVERVNRKIGSNKLFNFRMWMQFIEMRKLLIAEYHFPTKLSINRGSESHMHLHIEYLKSNKSADISLDALNEKELDKRQKTLLEAMLTISKIQNMQALDKIQPKSYKFEPSLTPNTDYLAKLMNEPHILIPDILRHDFRNADFEFYFKKNLLAHELRKNYAINLKFEKIKRTKIQLNKNVSKHHFDRSARNIVRSCNRRQVYVDIVDENNVISSCDSDYEKAVQKDSTSMADNAKYLINETIYQQHHESLEGNLSDIESDDDNCNFETEPEYIFKKNLKTTGELKPNRDLEESLHMFNNQSEDELSADDDSSNEDDNFIEFYIPNFQYWRRMCNSRQLFCNSYEKLESEFPKSFSWLLKECARIAENSSQDLYREVLTLETCFIYFMKPLNRNTRRLKFRKLPNQMVPRQLKAQLNDLRNNW